MSRRLLRPKPTETVSIRIDLDRQDYSELRGFVSELLEGDPDADVEQELRQHLATACHMVTERARHRGFL